VEEAEETEEGAVQVNGLGAAAGTTKGEEVAVLAIGIAHIVHGAEEGGICEVEVVGAEGA
jgi:hypothetical protein